MVAKSTFDEPKKASASCGYHLKNAVKTLIKSELVDLIIRAIITKEAPGSVEGYDQAQFKILFNEPVSLFITEMPSLGALLWLLTLDEMAVVLIQFAESLRPLVLKFCIYLARLFSDPANIYVHYVYKGSI